MSFGSSSPCASESPPHRTAKLISSRPTVKIIDECVLNAQERREEERKKKNERGEAWREEKGGRGQVLISTL